MRAVVLHEYGGPEKLKFEDNVPEPQISGSTTRPVGCSQPLRRAGPRNSLLPISCQSRVIECCIRHMLDWWMRLELYGSSATP
jgi:hypothetical protein